MVEGGGEKEVSWTAADQKLLRLEIGDPGQGPAGRQGKFGSYLPEIIKRWASGPLEDVRPQNVRKRPHFF